MLWNICFIGHLTQSMLLFYVCVCVRLMIMPGIKGKIFDFLWLNKTLYVHSSIILPVVLCVKIHMIVMAQTSLEVTVYMFSSMHLCLCLFMALSCKISNVVHNFLTAKNGTRSVDTLKRAPGCLDESGHHPRVLPEHEHQSKLAPVQKAFIERHLLVLWGSVCYHKYSL